MEEAGGEPKGRDLSLQPTVGQGGNPSIGHGQVVGRHRGRPPPDCVARLPKGAEARRVDWTKLLPPSLGVEIQAIQQVGLAPWEHPSPP